MLLHDSRRETRLNAASELVLLDEQDRTRWDQAKIHEGITVLDWALALYDPGPYQVQAGLQMLLRLDRQVEGYYPYHAACADLLRRTNQREAAADSYERALALCGNSAERVFLQRRLEEMLEDRS